MLYLQVYCTFYFSTGVATLSDYREKQTAPSDDDAQKFFAGGSERSGQMIEGPPRKKQTPDSIAKDVFEAAKKLMLLFCVLST